MDTTSDNRKGKALKVAGIVVLALVLALSGTFAWNSLSQDIHNEFKSTANPGARLHDDFSWTDAKKNKDIYVENFTDPNNGGVNVYARVQLKEYLEVGDNAGNYDPNPAGTGLTVTPDGANSTDDTGWAVHKFDNTHDPNDSAPTNKFHDHFTWQYGGSTAYMPTFNKNKDSLEVDVNGSYQDIDSTTGTQNPYCNYKEYAVGDIEADTAYYDADNDTDDEAKMNPTDPPGSGGVENTDYTKQSENHTAADTLSAEVISMADWKSPSGKNGAAGPFWVYDTDGWAYWAQPIKPGEATGLLLNNVELAENFGNDWYYAIDAIGEFVTNGEWEADTANNKWYLDAGHTRTMSGDAYNLLVKASEGDATSVSSYDVTVTAPAATVNQGGTATFTAAITENGNPATGKTVKWSVAGNDKDGTSINADTGVLTVADDETPNKVLTVTATVDGVAGAKGTATIKVAAKPTLPTALQTLKSASVASVDAASAVVNIDGTEYVKLAQNGDNVMVMPKNLVTTWGTDGKGAFGSSNSWKTSTALTWCNTYYNSLPNDIKSRVVDTTYKTKDQYNETTTYDTTSKVFFLTEADVFGTNEGTDTNDSRYYTYGNTSLVPQDLRKATLNGSANAWWLRSPRGDDGGVALVFGNGNNVDGGYRSTGYGARPAFWLNLAS